MISHTGCVIDNASAFPFMAGNIGVMQASDGLILGTNDFPMCVVYYPVEVNNHSIYRHTVYKTDANICAYVFKGLCPNARKVNNACCIFTFSHKYMNYVHVEEGDSDLYKQYATTADGYDAVNNEMIRYKKFRQWFNQESENAGNQVYSVSMYKNKFCVIRRING